MNPTVRGSFHLRPGTTLIPIDGGGIVFSARPLRALRVNRAAFDLLRGCEDGCSLCGGSRSSPASLKSALRLFDRLCVAGLMEWRPPVDEFEPFVSIVIAVYNRADEIGSCIESLLRLNYPRSKYEIIVVDDASADGTPGVVSHYEVKLIRQPRNRGQSAARNAGVAEAQGEIVAFIDSDCIAEPNWLSELVPYFRDSRNALVGGYVSSVFRQSVLDRYEEAKSPLTMGDQTLFGAGESSDFYVPTCNMLVRRDVHLRVGGLNEDMRVGEDVDYCWRLKEQGFRLVYVPRGRVGHKHRNRFTETFKRRFDYGTSEPVLYARHPAVSKHYPWQPACMSAFFLCLCGLFFLEPLFVPAAVLIFLWDVIAKRRSYERQIGIPIQLRTVLEATVVRHYELLYYLTSHVVRYYVVLMVLVAILIPPIIPVVAALVLFPALAEYFKKRPRLGFPVFLILFLAEQASYQAGVFRGCIEQGSFRTYRLGFVTSRSSKRADVPGKTSAPDVRRNEV